jgi:hypothetical protein
MGWTVWGSNPSAARFSAPVQTGLGAHSAFYTMSKVQFSCYQPSVAQRVGRGIALLLHDRGTRRGRAVRSTPQPNSTPPGKDPVPIVQKAGWAPGQVWTGGKSRPHWDSNPDHPARSQLLYQLSYLYNAYRVSSGDKAAQTWHWPSTTIQHQG